MKRHTARIVLFTLLALPLGAQSVDGLVARNVTIKQNYKGRSAVQLMGTPGAVIATTYAVVKMRCLVVMGERAGRARCSGCCV